MKKKILYLVLGLILIAGTVIYFYYDSWLESKLKAELALMIRKNPQGYYLYDFKKLNLRLLEGKVELKGISIIPKPAAFDSLLSRNSDVRALFELRLKKVVLEGLDIEQFLATGTMDIASLQIVSPRIFYYLNPHKKKPQQKTMPLKNIFSDHFQQASFELLTIEDAAFDIMDRSREDGLNIRIEGLNISLEKALMNRQTLDKLLPFSFANIRLKARSIGASIAEDFAVNTGEVSFNANRQVVSIRKLKINPKYSQDQFARKYPVQKQWFALEMDSLVIREIDVETFVTNGLLHIRQTGLYRPNVLLFKDKSKPMPPFRKKMLPASVLRQLPLGLRIDTLIVHQGTVVINEKSGLTGRKSYLSFHQLQGQLVNLTNDSAAISRNRWLALRATTRVMNQAVTSMIINIDLASPLDEFTVSGQVGAVDATAFNRVLDPMMGVKVTSGQIDKVSFTFQANDTLSTGVLDIAYTDLKIEVMQTDEAKANYKGRKGLMTFAANTLVKTHNVPGRPAYRQGIISAPRAQEKDIWPYLWHAIQSGLISSLVPITESKENKQIRKQEQKTLRQQKKAGRKKERE